MVVAINNMDGLIMFAQLILGISILVGVHELGHLLAAKAFGMRVEKFFIGFPPKIFGKKFGETEFEGKMNEFQSQINSEEDLEELLSSIEEYKSELEERLSNMPDALQESSVLNEYIDLLQELYDDVETIK